MVARGTSRSGINEREGGGGEGRVKRTTGTSRVRASAKQRGMDTERRIEADDEDDAKGNEQRDTAS